MQPEDTTLKRVRDLAWPQVFDIWRANEDYPGSHWESYWKLRGFGDWAQWRQQTKITPFELPNLAWSLWSVPFPTVSIPQFRGGPHKGWHETHYGGRTMPRFHEFAGALARHEFIHGIVANPPRATMLTGIILTDGTIAIMEGMHRCVAFTVMANEGWPIPTSVDICLASWPDGKDLIPR